ncbi:MAG: hypothetical protein IPK80_15305 [Nannocystis sp.]|nr:hypothetical protein [Nannocystis sp.]
MRRDLRLLPLVVTLLGATLPACSGDDSATTATTTAATTAVTTATTTTAGTTADSGGESTTTGGESTSASDTTTNATAVDTDSATDTSSGTDSDTDQGTDSDSDSATDSTTDADTDTDTDPGVEGIPVHDIPGLLSITFWERSGGDAPTPYTFEIWGSELTNILPDPLTDQSHDIKGVSTEFYDVYYSDIDGNFDVDGRYLTIAGAFGHALPAGGGLNLAEIALNYQDNSVEYGSYVASFAALGDNAAPDSAPKSIDGDLQTHTTMGNNKNEPDKRLRVTLGFESSLMPG